MRVAIPVDKKKLIDSIEVVRDKADGVNDLCKRAATFYNETYRPTKNITQAIVYLRAREWGMQLTTRAQRGASAEVSKKNLQKSVEFIESQGEIAEGRVKLYDLVADHYNKTFSPEKLITGAIVGYLIRQYSIEVKTKSRKGVGRKGIRGPISRTPRAEKYKKSKEAQSVFSELRKVTPARFLPVVDAIQNGSRAAAVKLKCVECSGWQTTEVRHCTVRECPLWLIRPYQGKKEEEEVDTTQEEQADESN